MRLIDADALKEKAFFHEIDNVSYVEEEDIDKAPTVDAVERKRGKWIYKDDDDTRYGSYWCSECHYGITVDEYRIDDIGFVIEDMNYCPHCGADMRGENNG